MNWNLVRRGSIGSTAALALVLTGPASAFAAPSAAAAAAVVATPATDLEDGATVALAISGFTALSDVSAAQCANLSDAIVCNPLSISLVKTDEQGVAATSIVVQRTFEAVTPGGEPAGAVDCSTVAGGCFAVVFDNNAFAAASISFRP